MGDGRPVAARPTDMTTTYDPYHAAYLDEADVRHEMSRVFDVCNGCRQCIDLCEVFPTLFELIDRRLEGDAGQLTPAQQDHVVDQCFQCTACRLGCPYTPERDRLRIDVPRLAVRARAMRRASRQIGGRSGPSAAVIAAVLTGRTWPLSLIDRTAGAPPGSLVRRVVEKLTGLSAARLVARRAERRFSVWFRRRPIVRLAARQGRIAVYPTCFVEHHDTALGHDVVHVLERNGVECTLADEIGCCGAPWLHVGDLKRFRSAAERVVTGLAATVRSGRDVVVPEPMCSQVIRHEYPVQVPCADAELVARHTFAVAEYLMRVHRGDHTTLDTEFTGSVPGSVTYQPSDHLRSQHADAAGRDLIRLTGASVDVVHGRSGRGGIWGLRAEHAPSVSKLTARLAAAVARPGNAQICGSCRGDNLAIAEHTGEMPVHPVQLLARAYGIPRLCDL